MAPNTTQETEFVWRRLADPLKLFGQELDGHFSLAILIPVLIIACAYVIWMYVRDGRSVGWGWASLLGALRIAVYLILALVFLLPAEQTWERTETRSKVILLIDVSGSMASKDGIPSEAIPVEKLLSRQDQDIQLLTRDQIKFIKRLQEKNPVTLYRCGQQIDETFRGLDPEAPSPRRAWNAGIQLPDLQALDKARPEDTFLVRVEIDGKGLADQNVEVTLEVTKPNGEKMMLPPALKPGESIRFRPGEPPHAQVGFDIVKPELEGEWKFVARVPKDKRAALV